MGLEPDDHVKLETLLYGMMLPSGNDAAEQVAVSLAGSREQYVGWMNEKVAALHLRDTHFVTPSGMDCGRALLERLRHGAAGSLRHAEP